MSRIKKILLRLIGKHKKVLGIDIRGDFVRILEVLHSNNGYQIEYCANFTLKEGVNSKKLIKILKSVLKRAKSNYKAVVTSVSYSNIFSTTVDVSSELSDKEIIQFLKFNLKELVGFSKDEVVFDYHINAARCDLKEKCEHKTLDLVAAKRGYIDKLKGVLRGVNISPDIIDVDVYALERVVRSQFKKINGLIAIISIELGNILLVILDDQKIVYVHEEGVKGGVLPSVEPIALVINSKIENVCANLRSEIEKIILAGENTLVYQLKSVLSKKVKAPVVIANPFAGVKLGPDVSSKLVAELAPMMLVVFGLVIRGFDEC